MIILFLLCVCGGVRVNTGFLEAQRGFQHPWSWKVELSCMIWVLGTQFRSSTRAVRMPTAELPLQSQLSGFCDFVF